jgi:hypothetical protein
VRIARRYPTVQIRGGPEILTAADSLHGDLHEVIIRIGNADDTEMS